MSILSIGSLLKLSLEHWILLSLLLFLGVAITRTLEWVWWRPKRLEKILRQQGIRGNPYKILVGDIKDGTRLSDEVKSKPLPIGSHDIASRADPLLSKTMKDHGDLSITWLGTHPRLIISEPDLIKEILSTKFNHFEKPKLNPILNVLITGIITYNREKWVKHRRIIDHAFYMEKLKNMLPVFTSCCCELIDRWEKSVGSNGSCELDVQPEFQNLTADVITRSSFGSSYEEGRRVFQLQDEQARLLPQAFRFSYIPGFRFLPARINRRKKEIEKEVRSLLGGVIQKRKRGMEEGTKCEDLLGYLLESNLKDSEQGGSSDKTTMTMDDIVEECKLFYFAGHETTSNLLCWTMILLCIYPDWQERARAEVIGKFGKNKPDFDGLNRLKIVTMILHESLRLYSPATVLVRRAYKEVQLGRFIIPKGVRFVIPTLLVHHDARHWGDDANEFKPERFAEGVAKASKTQMAFFPFGGGPRVCVGQGFAMNEAKLALCMILQRFSFELSPTYIHAPHVVITLQPQHGAQIILRRLC